MIKKSLKLFAILAFVAVVYAFFPKTAQAAACSDVTPSTTSLDLTVSCSFAGNVNGIDGGSITIESGATLTIPDQQILTILSIIFPTGSTGSTVTVGNGQIKPGLHIYMVDADADGYAATTTQYTTLPANGVLRSTITSLTTTDCYDNNPNAKPGQTTAYAYPVGNTNAGALVQDNTAPGLVYDFDCNSTINKFRTTVDTPTCANNCSIAQHPNTDVTAESTACGTTNINAGYASVVRNNDVYGVCVSCTGSGSVLVTMSCR